jgi:uncharacterized LabA/DUF88 family protein
LVEYVKSQGCQVEAITFGRSASGKLRETVDDFIDMDENPHAYLIGYKPAKKSTHNNLKKTLKKVVGTDTDGM